MQNNNVAQNNNTVAQTPVVVYPIRQAVGNQRPPAFVMQERAPMRPIALNAQPATTINAIFQQKYAAMMGANTD